ncbi:two-component response regulator ORR23-like isoform X1 [Solanum tuberosum]|uniref:two-component response regulator ORR23-like isoform X1 n=1 Tax=Solanum tuberosum TaxID=4113 RepID=UPI0003D27045|nr:PREDICTED: two-component response regulator ORR23-like isoform X1 [Solanum tuberosum]
MEVETHMSFRTAEKISILVVDDDATFLPVVAGLLKKCNYQVVTVKYPIDALSKLKIKGDSFDLVVTDVHKSDMNGFELQQVITQAFEIPVLSMSVDDKEGTILKGLNGVSVDDQRGQGLCTALQVKRGKKPVPGKSAMKLGKQGKDNSVNFVLPTKSQIIWTESLHNAFLEAIRNIGFDKAVPKKIHEHMKVPGLTRENVASHWQKYRIYLRRVTDASSSIQVPDINLASRANQSTIASGTLGKHRQFHQKNFGVQCSVPSLLIHTTVYRTGSLQHLKNKKEVDVVLNPVRNFSVFHNVSAMQGSQGIGDLSASSMNQGNDQPHQQNNEDEAHVNFDGGFNQDMEKGGLFAMI